jgi:hypothetical protein
MPRGSGRGRRAPRIPRGQQNAPLPQLPYVNDENGRDPPGDNGRQQQQEANTERAATTEQITQVEIRAEHTQEIRETEDHFKSAKTVKDHNRRIMEMIRWVKAEYVEYSNEAIIELTEEQKADKKRYHNSTHDFKYRTINVEVIKAFLSKKKYHPNRTTRDGKPVHYSFSHLRKFQDAILFGAHRAKVPLPEIYEMEMKSYIDSIKKEKTKAKKRGETDEREADPISFELYSLLCKYAIEKGDMFVWAFTVVQWSCMARSVSIDDLTFGQISLGTDSVVIQYCDSKADQKGERTSPKNCYANPFDYKVCIFTALACFFCINDESWSSQKDTIFRNRKASPGTASHRYCNAIRKIYNENKATINEFVRAKHFNAHGTRKGAAICASSGTTLPASLAAIANRGEWTISMMFEIYLGFAEPGDQYLGRLLAGLLPNSSTFAALPPHFTCGMENEHVAEAMNSCFIGIIDQVSDEFEGGGNSDNSLRANTKGLLLRCLASLVHHSDSLKQIIDTHPGHPFASIPLFSRAPTLLSELKKLVTTEPSERVRMATGIPPHVEAMSKLDDLYKLIKEEREERRQHYEEIKNAIGDKIGEIAEENGQLTRPAVEKLFEDFGRRFENKVTEKIDQVLRSVVQEQQPGTNTETNRVGVIEESDEMGVGGFQLWNYDGKFWQVPKDFALPGRTKRKRAWELWISGMTVGTNGDRIRPFRQLKPPMMPKKVRSRFKTEWQPILKKMEAAPEMNLPRRATEINATVIDTTFVIGTLYLKEICSFLWEKERSIIENWSVASWSTYTQRNYILKNGNASDIAKLPTETRFNSPHRRKRTIKKRKHDGGTSTTNRDMPAINIDNIVGEEEAHQANINSVLLDDDEETITDVEEDTAESMVAV